MPEAEAILKVRQYFRTLWYSMSLSANLPLCESRRGLTLNQVVSWLTVQRHEITAAHCRALTCIG